MQDFTRSNGNLSRRSRIYLFLISTNALYLVKDVSHSSAPLSDHKLISLKLCGSQDTTNLRGYWKFNNSLLQDNQFNDRIKEIIEEIYTSIISEDGYRLVYRNIYKKYRLKTIRVIIKKRWEYFKYMSGCAAVRRSVELKVKKNQNESEY